MRSNESLRLPVRKPTQLVAFAEVRPGNAGFPRGLAISGCEDG